MAGKKRRRRSMETPYARITEIREAATSEEANECLNGGFVLIKAVEKRETDALGRQASNIVYVLGKLRQNGTQTATHHNGHSEPQPDSPIVDPRVLEGRPWRAYAKGEGEWTFVVNQDGSPVAELEPASQFLDMLKDGDDLVVGAYRYRLRDKFLKRYPADGQSA
jgi:hypothetical protein